MYGSGVQSSDVAVQKLPSYTYYMAPLVNFSQTTSGMGTRIRNHPIFYSCLLGTRLQCLRILQYNLPDLVFGQIWERKGYIHMYMGALRLYVLSYWTRIIEEEEEGFNSEDVIQVFLLSYPSAMTKMSRGEWRDSVNLCHRQCKRRGCVYSQYTYSSLLYRGNMRRYWICVGMNMVIWQVFDMGWRDARGLVVVWRVTRVRYCFVFYSIQ